MKLYSAVLVLVTLFESFSAASGAETQVKAAPILDATSDFVVDVVLSGLDNPLGLALVPTSARTEPHEFFFAESGAGRIVHFSTANPQQLEEVVSGFPIGTMGDGAIRVGPLALAFVSRAKLIVASKSDTAGADVVSGYSLSEDGTALQYTSSDYSVGPVSSDVAVKIDDFQLLGLALSDKNCFFTTGGIGSQGWIIKSGIEANRLTYLQPFVELSKHADNGSPGGVAVIPPPRAPFLVTALMGGREATPDSRLVFFIPSTGQPVLNLPTGLFDVVSLAYSPSGQLYAADFSWHDAQAGGVYRLDDARVDGRQTVRAVKIASVVRPWALAFAPDGTLYVTALGASETDKQGTVSRIRGDL